MALANLRERLNGLNLSPAFGVVIKVEQGFLSANGLSPRIGDIVKIVFILLVIAGGVVFLGISVTDNNISGAVKKVTGGKKK